MRRFWGKVADYIRECDKALLLLSTAASLFGCAAVASATYRPTGSPRQFIVQLSGLLIGLAAAVTVSTFSYRSIERLRYLWLAASVALVGLTFIIGYAPPGTDDKAWLRLFGGMTLQPAELLKIAFVITFAYHLSKVGKDIGRLRNVALLAVHAGAVILLIHLQGDDGTALVFAVMAVAMLWAAGIPKRYMFLALGILAVAAPFIYFFVLNSDQRARLALMFDVEQDLQGSGWQQWRARIALANGGVFGMGPFRGELTGSGGVPEEENDFIFASIGEEYGIVGCVAVIALLTAIAMRIFKIGAACENKSASLMCVGVASMILGQSVINIGMNVSLLPVIGITLPFFSAGGTGLVCLFLSVGLVLSAHMEQNRGAIHLRG